MNGHTDFQPPAVDTPVSAVVVTIGEAAANGRLVICAGAGLSQSTPAGLPSGSALGGILNTKLAADVEGYAEPANPADLVAVADAGAAIPGGQEALRTQVLALADFLGATPNHGHEAIAQLLCEGAVQCVLLWNWDDCIERSDTGTENLQVARSKDDLDDLQQPFIAKIHGCATRRSTLLVTSLDLNQPAPWTEAAFLERIRNTTAVFIGVGDVADYAKRRLEELKQAVFSQLDIYVVSPGIIDKWDQSAWSSLVPELGDGDGGRRIPKTADEFLDELARRWVLDQFQELRDATKNMREEVAAALEVVLEQLGSDGAVDVIRWARRAAIEARVGTSAIRCTQFQQLLIALAVLQAAAGATPPVVRTQASIEVGGERLEALTAASVRSATEIRAEARRRAERLAGQETIRDRGRFIVAGDVMGHLDDDPDQDLDMANGEAVDGEDVFAGQTAIRLSFRRAAAIVAEAA